MNEQAKIDRTDAKILRRLLSESRTSFTDIAAECGITVAAVRMRYKKLWKDGIINGEKMLVNPHCLGYPYIVDLGIVTDVANEKKVAFFLESKNYMSQITGRQGKYAFYSKVALQDLNKLHQITEDLEENPLIKKVDALIWSEAAYIEYPENLIIGTDDFFPKKKNYVPPKNIKNAVELDETDKKMAKILAENSRISFEEISKNLQITSKTVVRRYKKLRESVLTLSTVTVNLNKLGYNALANMYIDVSNGSKISEIKTKLLEIPNLIVIINLIGAHNLYCGLVLENFEKLFQANERLRSINGIESTTLNLGRAPVAWPLNLFPSLLEKESMPKYWRPNDNNPLSK